MTEANQKLNIGDLDDGGVYVGLSAEDGKPLHAALADEPQYLTFAEAFEAAKNMRKEHPDRRHAHVPTPEELDENLSVNSVTGHLKGTFNTSGSYPDSVYRSCAPYGGGNANARVQWMGTRVKTYCANFCRLPVRLVL